MLSYSRSCWSDYKRGIGGVLPKVYERPDPGLQSSGSQSHSTTEQRNLEEVGSMLGAKFFAAALFLLRLS